MRSTPTPYDTLRTVKVEFRWPRLRRMTTPSKIWIRSLSPSLIFVCTRTVSPTRNAGTWPRASGFTFRCSTNSIAFARIFAPLLRPAPARDARVVAAEQRFRHRHPPEFGRPGVLRPLEQHLGPERLAPGTLL